jgi:hypothetical protein
MSFIDKLKASAEKLITLNITTAVGNAEHDPAAAGSFTVGKDAKIMNSSIDLLQGDITTIIPEAFMEAPYSAIREYHQAREEAGQQIIKENIACIKELLLLVEKLSKDGKA